MTGFLSTQQLITAYVLFLFLLRVKIFAALVPQNKELPGTC